MFTVQWDVESPSRPALIRTVQERLVDGVPEFSDIQMCGGPEAVSIELVPGEFYYRLTDAEALYPNAVPDGGDACLIQTLTTTVTTDPPGPLPEGSYSKTIEVFYIWADPQFVRR